MDRVMRLRAMRQGRARQQEQARRRVAQASTAAVAAALMPEDSRQATGRSGLSTTTSAGIRSPSPGVHRDRPLAGHLDPSDVDAVADLDAVLLRGAGQRAAARRAFRRSGTRRRRRSPCRRSPHKSRAHRTATVPAYIDWNVKIRCNRSSFRYDATFGASRRRPPSATSRARAGVSRSRGESRLRSMKIAHLQLVERCGRS